MTKAMNSIAVICQMRGGKTIRQITNLSYPFIVEKGERATHIELPVFFARVARVSHCHATKLPVAAFFSARLLTSRLNFAIVLQRNQTK
jgi:hypothetical protein